MLATSARNEGKQRLYREADVVRLQEKLLRLRDLLGLSLDELNALAEAEQARVALRDQWHDDTSDSEKAKIVKAAISLVERQPLKLVQARQRRLADFGEELIGPADNASRSTQRAAEKDREPPPFESFRAGQRTAADLTRITGVRYYSLYLAH